MKENIPTKRLTMIAMTACLITVCSWLTIPAPVPFSMQTFAIFCALQILGGRDGLASVCLYLLLGCIGLPVFSGFSGGIGHLLGPSGGYIIGFVLTALCYIVFEPQAQKSKRAKVLVLSLGLLLCYIAGSLWFCAVCHVGGTEYSLWNIVSMCVLPFIIPDMLNLFLSLQVCERVGSAVGKLNKEKSIEIS